MAIRAEDVRTELTLIERGDGAGPQPKAVLAGERRDYRLLYEREVARAGETEARANAADARAEEFRCAEVRTRFESASWKHRYELSRRKLTRVVEQTKAIRGTGNNAQSLQGSQYQKDTIKSLRTERGELRKEVTRLKRELAGVEKRLAMQTERSETRQAVIQRQHNHGVWLRSQLRLFRDQSDTVVRLSEQVTEMRWHLKASEARKATLKERIVKLRATGATLSKLPSDAVAQLRTALRRSRRQKTTIKSLYKDNARLRRAARVSATRKETMEVELARVRTISKTLSKTRSDEAAQLRKALRRSRRQKTTIKWLRTANVRLRRTVRISQSRKEALNAELAKVRASRAVLSKWLYGRGSEQRDKPRSARRRGQQPGAPGHGRTPRPGLEERIEIHQPPAEACVCGRCGTPYVANGERSTTIVEIDVKAHTRRIVRPRWRRRCDCADSPPDVIAATPDRVFARTAYGTTVWTHVLFERYLCNRPLNGVAMSLSHQGLPISAGTLARGLARLSPLFQRLALAMLEHQNEAAVRHGDETGWRIQALRQAGRSGRAWLWVSVTEHAVYFHIDPSRSAEAALKVFGGAVGVQVLVVDRYSTYKKLARVLEGRVILAWCWAHQRRDYIDCAAGQVELSEWCQAWLGRIAAIYRLNKTRLSHYESSAERQNEAFDTAQRALETEVKGLFATAERELAGLDDTAPEAGPLRSLLKHRDGLSVFLERPEVPMDNNFAERTLRSAVIGRRLSFGSDSEAGARFTAMMYSVVGTLALNGLNVRAWLHEWLNACAANGGRAPPDLSEWLPWSMSQARRRTLMAPG